MIADPLVCLISATPTAIEPAVEAIRGRLPAARIWNLLDDQLLPVVVAAGLTDALVERMRRLIGHAVLGDADAVLLTCSQYGPVAEAVSAPVPVLSADGAAFASLARDGYRHVLVAGSNRSSLDDSIRRLAPAAPTARLTGLVAGSPGEDPGAVAGRIVAAVSADSSVDAILLAQYSLMPAAGELVGAARCPVVTGPERAADRLASLLGGTS